MKFVVSYLFVNDEDEGVQVDIVNFKDKKSCEVAYDRSDYKVLEIEKYDEDAIMEEMYCEADDDLYDYDKQECEDDDIDIVEEGLSVFFPNVETEEELEEELEHSVTRMMYN